MATTSARTLRLLSMLAPGRVVPGAQLCRRLDVSARTVRRDVDVLRELGYAVDAVKGAGGGYRLGSGGALAPLVLDEDQVVAIAVALQAAPTVLAGIAESAERALATLRQVMPRRLRAGADAFTVTVVPNQWEFAAEPIDAGRVAEVGAAVRQRQVLRVGVDDGEPDLRVEPHQVVVWAARWYLVAYLLDAQAWRVLRLDRLRVGPATLVGFAERPGPPGGLVHLVKHSAERGDRVAAWPCVGRAVLDLPAAVVAEFVPGGGVVDPRDARSCRLRMGACSWTGLAGLYLTFGARLTQIEPAPLREAFRRIRDRLDPDAPE